MANRITHDPADAGHYEWQQPGLPPVSLRYNELLHSMRVQAGEDRRVFLLESADSSAAKVALFNEYGLRTGSCSFDDAQHPRGTLRWEDRKFRFRTEQGQLLLDGPSGLQRCEWNLPPGTNTEICAGILLMLARQTEAATEASGRSSGR